MKKISMFILLAMLCFLTLTLSACGHNDNKEKSSDVLSSTDVSAGSDERDEIVFYEGTDFEITVDFKDSEYDGTIEITPVVDQ